MAIIINLTISFNMPDTKTNVLEDYKSMQQILEKKLEAQNQALIRDKERVSEKLHQIERKFKTDKEKYKG